MATYGPNSGVVPFTGFSPTLGVGDATTPATSGQVQFNGMTQQDGEIARALFQGPNRVVRRLLNVLIGAASGTTATEDRTRVEAQQANQDGSNLGGLTPVETVHLINRASTATDITNLKAVINRTPKPSTYAADVSGNGGGGKVNF